MGKYRERPYQAGDGSLGDLAQIGLQLRKGLLDRVHVRAVGRQISQFGPCGFDELFDPRSLVGRQIVHDDDIALREGGKETFFHPFLEQGGVHRPVVDPRRRKPSKAQTGNEGDRLVMAVRNVAGAREGAPRAALGVVSFVGPQWRSLRGGVIDARIELDAALTRSSEGGLVLDAEGRALGKRAPAWTEEGHLANRAITAIAARCARIPGLPGRRPRPRRAARPLLRHPAADEMNAHATAGHCGGPQLVVGAGAGKRR